MYIKKKNIFKQQLIFSFASYSNQNAVFSKSKTLLTCSDRSIKTKQKMSPLAPSFAKFLGSKQLQYYVKKTMESEAHDHDFDSIYKEWSLRR